MDNTGRRDGLRIPMGSNPDTGLNNLFVMNINSRKLIRIAVRPAPHEARSKHEAMKSEEKALEERRGLERISNYELSGFSTTYDVHPIRVCCFSLPLSSSFSLSLLFLYLPYFLISTFALKDEDRAELSISRLPLTFRDLVRVIGMPEARRRALVTDIGGNNDTYIRDRCMRSVRNPITCIVNKNAQIGKDANTTIFCLTFFIVLDFLK